MRVAVGLPQLRGVDRGECLAFGLAHPAAGGGLFAPYLTVTFVAFEYVLRLTSDAAGTYQR